MNAQPEADGEDEAEEARKAAKKLATSTAKLARLGATVHELKSGGFTVSACGFVRVFSDVESLAYFANSFDSRA